MKKCASAFLFASLLVSTAGMAADAGPFGKGHKQVSVVAGSGNAFNDSYIVIGAGASYFFADGFNVGLQLESWLDGDPGIFKITASANYVFYQVPRISPYVGALVRYTDIEGRDALNSVGGRAGVMLSMGRNSYAGFGMVYESYLDCDERTYQTCDDSYPEITFTFAF